MVKKIKSQKKDKQEEFKQIYDNETKQDEDRQEREKDIRDKGRLDKPIPIGTKFSDLYEVVSSQQSKGGMGKAILCKGVKDNKYYVLKTFLAANNAAMLTKEIEFTLKLDKHPNIVYTETAIQETVDGKYTLFMVMELVKEQQKNPLKDDWWFAKTLTNVIENNEIDLKKAFTWAIEFCRGMQYLNSIGLESHKDIKPDNIFVTEDNHIKIADFGLVKFESKEYTAGSRKYIAPESRKDKIYNIKSDVYSFGIVMYEMFNSIILSNDKDLDSKKSKYCDEIIKNCIDKEPKQRYNTFVELEEEIVKESKKYFGENFEITNNQMSANDYFKKALGSEVIRNYDQAVELYTKAINLNPRFFEAYNNRGLARQETDRCRYWDVMGYKPYKIEELYGDFIKAIEFSNNEEQLIVAYNNATADWDNRELEFDITIMHPIIPTCNGEPISFEYKIYNKGIDSFDSKKYIEAIDCFDNFLKKANKISYFGEYICAYLFKGIARYILKQYSLAIKDFNKALKICLENNTDNLAPDTEEELLFNCYDCLAFVKRKQKKYLEAQKYRREANKYLLSREEISIYKEILKTVLAKYKILDEKKEIKVNSINKIYTYIDSFTKYNNISKIKIIGCGGSGTRTVNEITKFKLRNDIETYTLNSDSSMLKFSLAKNKIVIGNGVGCDGDIKKAEKEINDNIEKIKDIVKESNALILTTGLGRGFGSVCVYEIAKIAKQFNIPTIAVVTIPSNVEGGEKIIENSKVCLKELKKYTKAIVVVSNDEIFNGNKNKPYNKFYSYIDNILATTIQKFTTYIGLQKFNRKYKELE